MRISATAVLAISLATTSAVAASRRAKAQEADSEKAPKPAKFDPEWIEPFFKSGPARQAAERFRAEDWSAAESGFAKAVKALPKASPERRAARYLQALARGQSIQVGRRGRAVRRALRQLSQARPVSRLQRRALPAAER